MATGVWPSKQGFKIMAFCRFPAAYFCRRRDQEISLEIAAASKQIRTSTKPSVNASVMILPPLNDASLRQLMTPNKNRTKSQGQQASLHFRKRKASATTQATGQPQDIIMDKDAI